MMAGYGIQNLSNHFRHKKDASIPRIFKTYILAGFFPIGPERIFCCSTIKGKTILALHVSHLGFLFEDVSWLLVLVEQNTEQHFLP